MTSTYTVIRLISEFSDYTKTVTKITTIQIEQIKSTNKEYAGMH